MTTVSEFFRDRPLVCSQCGGSFSEAILTGDGQIDLCDDCIAKWEAIILTKRGPGTITYRQLGGEA
jgi:hypothetical protein